MSSDKNMIILLTDGLEKIVFQNIIIFLNRTLTKIKQKLNQTGLNMQQKQTRKRRRTENPNVNPNKAG